MPKFLNIVVWCGELDTKMFSDLRENFYSFVGTNGVSEIFLIYHSVIYIYII